MNECTAAQPFENPNQLIICFGMTNHTEWRTTGDRDRPVVLWALIQSGRPRMIISASDATFSLYILDFWRNFQRRDKIPARATRNVHKRSFCFTLKQKLGTVILRYHCSGGRRVAALSALSSLSSSMEASYPPKKNGEKKITEKPT